MKTAKDILEFWFGTTATPNEEKRKSWYFSTPEFDQLIQEQFEPLLSLAEQGRLTDWQKKPLQRLALIILCDQFPRNIYRGTKKAFSYDSIALKNSRLGIEKGEDKPLNSFQKLFFYMPLMHAEDMEAQDLSLKQFGKLAEEDKFFAQDSLKYAKKHYDIVAKFGRYPYRNKALLRKTTPEEEIYLKTADTFGQ